MLALLLPGMLDRISPCCLHAWAHCMLLVVGDPRGCTGTGVSCLLGVLLVLALLLSLLHMMRGRARTCFAHTIALVVYMRRSAACF